ncbi:bacterioferritin [Pelistega sp. NLN82]|uniref:Bacterioferritin-associated ferredoxin n=1 Tax=Pelistega ratti TaxID=2652177 RepID=A0A6L9Y5G9_9BURK|nr:bacterioferritin [Pelistega ratti]
MYVCICNAISDKKVKEAVANGARTLADLQAQLGVATCCGCCAGCAESYLEPQADASALQVTEVMPSWKEAL